MNKIFSKFKRFSINFIYIFAAIIFSIFFITSLIVTTKIPEREFPEYILFSYSWIIFFIIHILVIYLILKNYKKINERYLILTFSIIYFILGIYIIFSINSSLRADAEVVWRSANLYDNNDFGFFTKGNYFDFYPHQLGLLHFNRILQKIYNNPRIFFAINLICVININFILYKIVDILFSNKKINLLTIYLSFIFLPQFFFISFAYNLIIGLFFAILGLYYLIKYKEIKIKNNTNIKLIYLILSAIFFAISTILRNNYMILIIASIIYISIIFYERYKIGIIIFISAFLLFNNLFSLGINNITSNKTGIEITEGASKNLWVAMGTDPEKIVLAPGWYNSYVRETIKNTNYDYDIAKEIGNEKIKENFIHFKNNPKEIVNFFGIKIISTWQEPTFQAFWSGPQEVYDQVNENKIISSLYNQGRLYRINFNLMKSTLVLFYLTISIYLWKYREKENIIFILYFLGGFIFHIFWETKAQYVYPYIYLMIPVVSSYLSKLDAQNNVKKYLIK